MGFDDLAADSKLSKALHENMANQFAPLQSTSGGAMQVRRN